ncbi:conserved Plasmodium protein, unknown function [Plasmodium knowlesi strain H]|uniref:Uncharacterized protein n=3 Tax=Plasmodium knowlesi TaxID=5850 RepID=A0A5K1V3K2_PLAKH|nr:conserved Plasmodium protein, unknown function [Plasmodium knowlesi strain H]OTN67403.1 Uncharacterized protein PKNOH_S06434500 [Plasmodium knowlesi]CAA9987615.1 conserved Plasmodium protein, unknown function [Plasmodium knowlesi strain H]SBO26986.1 conserved Plasmodium protein, unknown function [Plasmodium knowlesi strain H]SBO29252.1 conserved Plasmodium protein, unknown function [Plasmodium knowlesi strain H]VVS77089.1 conserved Plasmodium protein, unknown function [Plasmodium knowlesi s|eukprot:XP_002258615.1 hypothetical protein, conserved in Plasmodium species [Plasmodium knowlesi strain H]
MEETFFLQNFENINEESIPAPLIHHCADCREVNSARRKIRGGTQSEQRHGNEGLAEDQMDGQLATQSDPPSRKDNYLCINANAFNGKCYRNQIPILDDIHLRFTLGESLTYLLNAYLRKGLIHRTLYNKMVHSFQVAIIGTLRQLKESRGKKWTIKGKLINFKKENNIQLFYVENAVLSFGKFVLHVPLLKMKSIDL